MGWGTFADAAKRFRRNHELLRGSQIFKNANSDGLYKYRNPKISAHNPESQKLFFKKMRQRKSGTRFADKMGSITIGLVVLILLFYVVSSIYDVIINYN